LGNNINATLSEAEGAALMEYARQFPDTASADANHLSS
jgi:hypothetical protein